MTRSVWLDNSTSLGETASAPSIRAISFATGFISIAILAHSYYLHDKKFGSVRLCTDIAAIIGALSGLFTFLSVAKGATTARIIILNNLLINGLFAAILQLCDSYMFYSRMLAVRPKMRISEKILIVLYIWIVLIFLWLPTFTIVPFFYDTNSMEYVSVFNALNTTYTVGNVLYNFYFTFQCLYVLNGVSQNMKAHSLNSGTHSLRSILPTISNSVNDMNNTDKSLSATYASLKRIRIIAIKSIGHAITSSFAILFYAYGGKIGFNSWPLFIILGMHFWFNVKLEIYICPVEEREKMKTRNEREREAIQKGRNERRVEAEDMLFVSLPRPPASTVAPAPYNNDLHRHHHSMT